MTLVAHLVRADLRRFRLLLAAWVVMEVLNTVFTAVQPTLTGNVRTMHAAGLLAMVLFLTRWLGMVFIVPLVVQTHPLVGSDAFWMTRPIPPQALLASKVLLLGSTFVLVPALCEVVLMAACRVPIAEIVLVALQTMLIQSLWLGIVMSLSAVTRNLARFVLVAGGVLGSIVVLISVGVAVTVRALDGPLLGTVSSRSVASATLDVAALLLLIAAAVLPLIVQYKTRFTRVSVGAGVAGFAVAILVALMWPRDGELLPVPAWAGQESALGLVTESSTGEFRARDSWPGSNRTASWQIGHARLRLRGVEPGWLPSLRFVGATVAFGDGATVATVANGYIQLIPFESVDDFPDRVVMRQVLGVGRVAGREAGPFLSLPVPAIAVSQADFEKYSSSSGTYRGRFLVDLDRVEIAAALPLRAGAEYHDRRRRIVIDEVSQQANAAFLRVRQFVASTMFDSETLPRLSFYLRNRNAGEAVEGIPNGAGGVLSANLAFPLVYAGARSAETTNGFTVKGDYLRFPYYDSRENTVPITADWLSHAELVIVRTVAAGSVTRTLEIPGFEFRPAPASPVPRFPMIR